MFKNEFNEKLFNFISKSTCSFTCISTIKKMLLDNGYKQLYENDKWNLTFSKYFVIRNDASIIAFNIGKNYKESFNIVCTHSDTPGFYLKPKSEIYEHNYLKINVMPYGGILNYGWMDVPLSIAGRVIYKDGNVFKKKIIDINDSICVIPSVAIHQNDTANVNLDLNTQIDLIPIISLSKEENIIDKVLNKYYDFNGEICDYDLYLYNNDKPKFIGYNNEMILSPRIDDLSCVYASLEGFIQSNNDDNINIMCIFNSEEIGSLTKEGADSSFLMDILKRICASLDIDISVSLRNSFVISADNSHAVHPNHPNKSDINNQGFLNKGVLIVREKGTSTDSVTSSIFKNVCEMADVPYQDYSSRNDMSSGGTLSGLSVRHVSVDTIDIGLAQLAMHSSIETIGSDDTFYLYKVLNKFYDTSIKRNCDDILINDR